MQWRPAGPRHPAPPGATRIPPSAEHQASSAGVVDDLSAPSSPPGARQSRPVGGCPDAQGSSSRGCGPGTIPAMSGSSPGAPLPRSPRRERRSARCAAFANWRAFRAASLARFCTEGRFCPNSTSQFIRRRPASYTAHTLREARLESQRSGRPPATNPPGITPENASAGGTAAGASLTGRAPLVSQALI